MTTKLRQYFPMIKTRDQLEQEIKENPGMNATFQEWSRTVQEEFLDFCTGARGVKMLYDSFFKEIFNPITRPGRLEELLSLLMGEKVKILKVLPNESNRIADEGSLLIMDIIVELETGEIVNVECQKIGYTFPGQRAACYSADLLMRQYRRLKAEKGKAFSYRDVKRVYTIIFYEKSPADFKNDIRHYIHRSVQKTDTGVKVELLQQYTFLTLDIFLEFHHNENIKNKTEAWLTFLCNDKPEEIVNLIRQYPQFCEMYKDVYTMCANTERVMEMFSEELKIMDRNTVKLMMDEMQEMIEEQKANLKETTSELAEQKKINKEQSTVLAEQKKIIEKQAIALEDQKKTNEEMTAKIVALEALLAQNQSNYTNSME